MLFRRFMSWSIALVILCSFANAQILEDEDDSGAPLPYYNVALASSGATAVASSFSNSSPYFQPPDGAINGDRKGLNWWTGEGGWSDGTPGVYPDWLEIRFANQKRVDEIDVFTLQDDNVSPSEPTSDMTFSLYGIVDFSVQYWDGFQWKTLASTVNNNKVWTRFLFPSVSTDRIRVFITKAKWQSRIVEVEVWGQEALEAAPLPLNFGGCAAVGLGPCEMTYTLHEAIVNTNDVFHYRTLGNWAGNLNWNFSNWVKTSSENIPPLAHSIALWVEDPRIYGELNKTRAINWWKTFLDCQNGESSCPATAPENLRHFKGVELFSAIYDATTTIAVIGVRQWAVRNNHQELAVKAGLYLRNTWILYALASGQNRATRMINRFNERQPESQWCQRENEPPFLPLAGMRSAYWDLCGGRNVAGDQRSFLFGRALNVGPVNNIREALVHDLILDEIESQPQGTLFPAESAYGLVDWHRSLLRRIISPTNSQQLNTDIDTVLGFIAPLRTKVRYHFLAISDASQSQIRITLMEGNLNPNTAPTMSVMYNSGTQSGRFLYPYSNKQRTVKCINPDGTTFELDVKKPHRQGIGISAYGKFLSNNTVIEVSNEAPGTTRGRNVCIHEDHERIVERMTVPSGTTLYHILLSPGAKPDRVN
jgi:hypothetical protein